MLFFCKSFRFISLFFIVIKCSKADNRNEVFSPVIEHYYKIFFDT